MATNNAINLNGSGLARYDGAGSFSAVTTTIHDVLLGAASNGITNLAPHATPGIALVSAGAAADPVFSTVVISGGGSGATSFNINGAVFSNTTGTGALSAATLTSGQLLIGGTTTPAAAALTAGSGISIANGNNSITITATGGGIAWIDTTGVSATLAVDTGYYANNAGLVTFTLPATAPQFSTIRIVGVGAGGFLIAQNANQSIQFGSASATTTGIAGSLASTNRYDCVELTAVVGGASTLWQVMSSVGNLTIV